MGHILYNPRRSGVTETFTMCGTRNGFVIIKQGIEIGENFDHRSKSGEGGEKKESGKIKVNKYAYFPALRAAYMVLYWIFFTDKAPKGDCYNNLQS